MPITRRSLTTTTILLACALCAVAPPAFTQDAEPSAFEKSSAAYRTALHYDPSLTNPLSQLVNLYRKANRLDELSSIYQAHIAQYPADAGAKAVLVRIFQATQSPQAEVLARQAIAAHPEHAYLHFLHFQVLGDVASLSRAIELETRQDRKLAWVDRLLEEGAEGAEAEGAKLAERHLTDLLSAAQEDGEALLQLAGKMHRFGFPELGLKAVEAALKLAPAPERNVDLQLRAAKLEAALEQNAAAGERLGALLAKVAPDYWRRGEIAALRVQLLDSNAARESLLELARKRYESTPGKPEPALELAELLVAAGLRKEAARVLGETARKLPHVQVLEQMTLDLLEELGDDEGAIGFLEARLADFPERRDLRYRLVQALFLANDPDAALTELDAVLSGLETEERLTRRLDLARFLRRMNLANQAARIYEAAVADAPSRLDVRRELAEAYLALDRREDARRLVAESEIADAEIENFLDFTQFMSGRDFLSEARRALEKRLETEGENLDLRLHLVDVLGRMGDFDAGEGVLGESRDFADTAARFRQWLEAGMDFHAEFDRSGAFFEGEYAKLAESLERGDSQPGEDEIARFLILCEVGEANRQRERVAQLLRVQLDSGRLTEKLRIGVRRMLVRTLTGDPNFALEVESQLKSLLAEDSAQGDEYRLRLALLYHASQRPDLSQPLLRQTNLQGVGEGELLEDAYPVYLDFGMDEPAISALRRLTSLQPANHRHWEALANLLAGSGREAEFRGVLTSLLAGAQRLELSQESVAALRKHLADSHWRSVSRALDAGDVAEVTTLLDQLDRQLAFDDDRLWSLWARAFAFNQLGQIPARDEAIRTMLGRARNAKLDAIAFPDGLAIGLNAAERLLTEPNEAAGPKPGSEPIVSEALGMRWAFEADPGATIVQIAAASEKIAVVMDHRRTIYGIDAQTGKLSWKRKSVGENQPAMSPNSPAISGSSGGTTITVSGNNLTIRGSGSITISGTVSPQTIASQLQTGAGANVDGQTRYTHRPPRFVSGGGGRIFLAETGSVICLDAASGQTRWTCELSLLPAKNSVHAPPNVDLGLAGGRLLSFDPASSTAAAIDPESGKLLWKRQIPDPAPTAAKTEGEGEIRAALNSGASFGAERMLIFGAAPAILDSRSGETLWRFSGASVRRFPMQLRSTEQDAAGGSAIDLLPSRFVDRAHGSSGSFLKYRSALVAPAVAWHARKHDDGEARLAAMLGRRMLLMGPDGVGALSLDLPMGARRYDVRGVYLGGFGSRAAFLGDGAISVLNFGAGETRTLRLDDGGRVEAFVHGNRIFAAGRNGIRCWNLNTCRQVFQLPWPPAFVAYAQKHAAFEAPADSRTYWQGHTVRQSGAEVCLPVRSIAANGMLFILVDDGVIAAFGPRESIAAR